MSYYEVVGLVVTLGVLILVTSVLVSISRSALYKRVTLLDWALLCFGGIYGAGLAIVALATQEDLNPIWTGMFGPAELTFHALLAILVMGTLILGWKVLPFRVTSTNGAATPHLPALISAYVRSITRIAWSTLIIAIVSQFIYSQAYGGLIAALDYSRLVRAGHEVPPNAFSFLRPVGGLAFLSSYLFLGVILGHPRQRSVYLGFFCSVLVSGFIMISWVGRLTMAIFLLTIFLMLLLHFGKRPVRLIGQGLVGLALTLFGVHYISTLFNLKPSDTLLQFLATELSSPFASFAALVQSQDAHFRWFYDLIVSPAFLLPERVWLPFIENLGAVHTAMVVGVPKGVASNTTGIPVDLITLGYWQGGVLGVLIVGFLSGVLLRLLQSFLGRIPVPYITAALTAALITQLVMRGIFYAQPSQFMSSNFTLFVVLSLVAIANSLYYRALRAYFRERPQSTS